MVARSGRLVDFVLSLAVALASASPPLAAAQQDPPDGDAQDAGTFEALEAGSTVEDERGIEWLIGSAEAKLGEVATIALPAGMAFTGKNGTQKFLRASGNLSSGNELGIVESMNPDSPWWACFEYD